MSEPARLGAMEWILVAFGLAGFIFGLLVADPGMIIIAFMVGIFFLLTVHRRYELHDDTLVINYWGPRRKTVRRDTIQSAHRVKLPLKPESLILRQVNGRHLVITPADPQVLLSRLPQPAAAKANSEAPAPANAAEERRRRRRRRRRPQK